MHSLPSANPDAFGFLHDQSKTLKGHKWLQINFSLVHQLFEYQSINKWLNIVTPE